MGLLAERLDDIRIRVRAPGAEIEAELSSRNSIILSFGESIYEFISERFLEHQLVSVARLLHAGWQREYRSAVDGTGLNIDPTDQHDLNFRDERRLIEASGASSDGRVRLSTVGMTDFSARIKRGTVRELRQREFVARVREAAAALIDDYRTQVKQLKVRYYG
jgi:hypothetical protein